MFQSVGRPARSPRARLGAFLLSIVMNGAAIAGLALLGAPAVEAVVEAELGVERPYALAVPEAPAPGAPAGKPAARPKAARAAASEPTIPPAMPAPLAAVPDAAPPVPAAPADGAVDGAIDGSGDDDGDGAADGGGGDDRGDGEGGGGGGGGVRTVHWSEVAVKVRPAVRPSDYPDAATALNLPDTRCVVHIRIDARGYPDDVVVKTCPEVFRAAAENLALRYRFHPLLGASGRPVRAGFDLSLNFRRGD